MARRGRFGSEDAAGLRRILGGTQEGRGVILTGGEGSIDVDSEDPVHIAVVFDVQGYGPHIGAIYADQNRYHASSDTALQAAYEILEQEVLDSADPEYIKELEDEWGDEWHDILTETIDGQTWTLSARDAFSAIRGTEAMDYIDVYDDEGNELSGANPYADYSDERLDRASDALSEKIYRLRSKFRPPRGQIKRLSAQLDEMLEELERRGL